MLDRFVVGMGWDGVWEQTHRRDDAGDQNQHARGRNDSASRDQPDRWSEVSVRRPQGQEPLVAQVRRVVGVQSMTFAPDDGGAEAEEQDREDDLAGAEEAGLVDGDVVVAVVVFFC